MVWTAIGDRMREADAFDGAAFLGLARTAKRDPYRLSLFGEHLDVDERPVVVLPVHGGTLIVTDRRLLELRAHLEVHGAWNVKEFRGYTIHRAIDLGAIQDIVRAVRPARDAVGDRRIDDSFIVQAEDGPHELLVSKGPAVTLPEEDFTVLRDAVLRRQPK